MLRQIMWANLLVFTLLTMQCGQTGNSNLSNTSTVNSAATNAARPAVTPGSSNTVTPSPGTSNANTMARPGQERVPPPEKLPPTGEAGNDIRPATNGNKPATNTNANMNPRKNPRIEERKPPEREKP